MGLTERRCAHFFLSLTILLFGVTSTVLLYFAGQDAVDLFWGETATYKDVLGRINRRVVTDDWYGLLALRGWAFGLLYVVPGLTGLTAALFYNRPTMIVHFVVAIFVLVPGSVLHSIGAVGLVMYRLLVSGGASRQDPWLGDCVYGGDYTGMPVTEDLRCTLGRRALTKAIAAVAVLFASWLFVFAHVIYAAFTFSSVRKHGRKSKVPETMPNEYTRHTHELRVENESSQQPTGSGESSKQASDKRRGSNPTRPYRRSKVAPPVPPQSSVNRENSAETPRPSTSAEIHETDASTEQPKINNENTNGVQQEAEMTQEQKSLAAAAAATEDVTVETQDNTSDTPDDTIDPQESPIIAGCGSNESHTQTFVNPGFERL